MKSQLMTLQHEFHKHGPHDLLIAADGCPIHDALDAATCYLEAVVHGLRDLMSESAVSNEATLLFFAAETALALTYAAHAGVDASQGGAA
ncbi:hypothetical protein [Pseudomonas chlororaphis]|uniref:hypothetical protein n=1 Tax=Pseudomonas chlororaphis TaxID=587753 RepID=UPI001B311A64|nr:hypothetical protein [Pseudomonas chlororaphis]MBP5054348.1 hypothetical protein [Pseudomonas chlororaphis]MBP5140286.1 hypothetical protein [Pseudomonas chlororaphis]QTT99525.1 hypothetical protein HUT26_09650 [Pseudomonas chlororaphis]